MKKNRFIPKPQVSDVKKNKFTPNPEREPTRHSEREPARRAARKPAPVGGRSKDRGADAKKTHLFPITNRTSRISKSSRIDPRLGTKPSPHTKPEAITTFHDLIRSIATSPERAITLAPEPAPLGHIPYEIELQIKNLAIRQFWEQNGLPDKPTGVVPSPKPRHYRSTSKRKLVGKTEWSWDFFSERPIYAPPSTQDWVLETNEHQIVYQHALQKFNEPPYQALANALNFFIVRGETELLILLNVHRLSADIVRKAKLLADHLVNLTTVKVVSVHLLLDKSKSSYYLEARVSDGPFHTKKLIGPEYLPMQVSKRKYYLHPTGFFQVNPSLLPRLIEDVCRGLKPDTKTRVIDLYCGCGLFTLPLSEFGGEVFGVEMSPVSCTAARMAMGTKGTANVRIEAGKIEPRRLDRLLPPRTEQPEVLLLDPPRQGTAPGLIRALGERKPRRIAHLFCDMDSMPGEVERWRKQGYMVAKVIPYDMFPGTDNLEVLVLLIPDQFGLLNRKKPLTAQI